jgi:DDE superfamily endonuclease
MFKRDRRGRKRVHYVDNCTTHVLTDAVEAALTRLNIEIRKLPPNSTHLTQPCDGFVIRKIKTWWSSDWDKYKAQMIATVSSKCRDRIRLEISRIPVAATS